MVSFQNKQVAKSESEAINREKYFLLREKGQEYLDKKAQSIDDFLEKEYKNHDNG